MYIMNKTMRAARPYEAPEAEIFLLTMEDNIMSVVPSSKGGTTPNDLVEVDYTGIWEK